MKVYVTSSVLYGRDEWEFSRLIRGAGHELVYPEEDLGAGGEEAVIRTVADGDAVLASSEPYTPRVFRACPRLRIVARTGVGYDAVDVRAATERGILVTITPGTNQDSVADLTMALLLSLVRETVWMHRSILDGRWDRPVVKSPRGSTLGIIGLGRIGKVVAQRALAFGFRILACETRPDPEFLRSHPVELVSLDQLLRESDYVSLHVPATPETKHLINAERIRMMKPDACIINAARGACIDEAALVDALRTGRLRGAALDVFEKEPPVGSPLLSLPNVVLSPHIAGVDSESLQAMAAMAARGTVDVLNGRMPTEGVVNPEAWARRRHSRP